MTLGTTQTHIQLWQHLLNMRPGGTTQRLNFLFKMGVIIAHFLRSSRKLDELIPEKWMKQCPAVGPASAS